MSTEKQTQALKLALEALEGCEDVTADVLKAITAIREALAEQPAQQQEPVAWLSRDDARLALWDAINKREFGNPTDDKLILDHLRKNGLWIGKYTSPQPAQQQYQSTADKCELTPVPAKGGLLPAQQQEPVSAIRALTDQCAALIQERDELQKQVWRYEKNGVTCQTYRHKIDRTCSECNVQEDYTSPQPAQQEPVAYAVYHRMGGSKTLHWPEQHSEDGDHNEYQLVPLYTSPPNVPPARASKPWVGLTDEEIEQVCVPLGAAMLSFTEVARAIEAKLKEKNGF